MLTSSTAAIEANRSLWFVVVFMQATIYRTLPDQVLVPELTIKYLSLSS